MDIVCFRQDGEWFGLPQGLIADLVPRAEIEPVGGVPDFVDGTASFRNRLIVAVRLRPLIWPERSSDGSRASQSRLRSAESMLVIGDVARRIGLPTDSVSSILDVREKRLAEHQVMFDQHSVITTVLHHLDRKITLLKPTRLVKLVETALGETTLRLFSGEVESGITDRWR